MTSSSASRTSRTAAFEFIDLILLYEGGITSSRLREYLDVSNVQASRVIAAYSDAFPRNIEVDKGGGRGRYRIGKHFKSGSSDSNIWSYLKLSSNDGAIKVINPVFDLTAVKAEDFRAISTSIRKQVGLRCLYKSMNNPKGVERLLFPHALTFVGRRWRVRAFDSEHAEFRDFNLGRLDRIELTDVSSEQEVLHDKDWGREISLQLIAHPQLSPEQQRLIRCEFFDGASARSIKCRAPLLKYIIRELEVAVDQLKQKPPEFQIAIGNYSKVEKWLF